MSQPSFWPGGGRSFLSLYFKRQRKKNKGNSEWAGNKNRRRLFLAESKTHKIKREWPKIKLKQRITAPINIYIRHFWTSFLPDNFAFFFKRQKWRRKWEQEKNRQAVRVQIKERMKKSDENLARLSPFIFGRRLHIFAPIKIDGKKKRNGAKIGATKRKYL